MSNGTSREDSDGGTSSTTLRPPEPTPDSDAPRPPHVLWAAAAGGLIGGLVGALIGSGLG